MKHIKLFEDYMINEIGEGSRPFPWKRIGNTKVGTWMTTMSNVDRKKMANGPWESLPPLMYEFKSDNATYSVRISAGFSKHTYINFSGKPLTFEPQLYNLIIVVSFDIAGKDDTLITNFGEQFRVLTTVVDIASEAVNEISKTTWVKLEEIRIAPKLEDNEEDKPITQTKRGRFYLEYIKKQGHRLPGTWTAAIDSEMFVLHNGKVTSSTHPENYIQL
jgi:hypothetical protein